MRIALMGGSLRQESLNVRLLQHLATCVAARGHEPITLTGAALRLPLLDPELPAPEPVTALAAALTGIQGLILVSPEYNAGMPAHLKNAVDWLSTLANPVLKDLPVQLAAASPGAFGGARGLLVWRAVLANLGALVLPGAITVPLADRNLGPDGSPLEARSQTEIERVLAAFLVLAEKLG